jgi:uncharacterized protein
VKAIEESADGVRVRLRIQPRSSRNEVAGLHGDAVKIRLSAPPVDGAANAALVDFLAEKLGVARSTIRLVSGQTSRSKVVAIEGLRMDEVAARLNLEVRALGQ